MFNAPKLQFAPTVPVLGKIPAACEGNELDWLLGCLHRIRRFRKLLFQLLAAWKKNNQQDIFSCPTINRNPGQFNAE